MATVLYNQHALLKLSIARIAAPGDDRSQQGRSSLQWLDEIWFGNPAIRMLITLTEVLPIGLLVALVSALLLRNPRFLPAPRSS